MATKLSINETLSLRQKYLGPSCQLFFKMDPLKIIQGKNQYLFDEKGNKYLDCINNVAHVGHCHPDVVNKGSHQMGVLSTNNRFLHDEIGFLAKKLASLFPPPLDTCFFVNSGSEANDLALRLARAHTSNKDAIVLDHAYHGHITTAMDLSPYKFNEHGVQKSWVHVASNPDTNRGKYTKQDFSEEQLADLYANEVLHIIEKANLNGRRIAAYIAESMQSCAGQIIFPQGYLKKVYEYVRKAGGVCIADEVQVGFGRVGTHWWAFQLQDVIPDIVTMGKPMGNGHPVSALITSRKIAESFFKGGQEYFNTFGGNPVSCAVALAVIDVIEKENLLQNAQETGKYLMEQLQPLKKQFNIVSDVRGIGLFVGIELMKNDKPAAQEAEYVIYKMKENGVLLSTDGPDRNCIKMKPPMCFNKENVDEVVTKLTNIFTTLNDTVFNDLNNTH